LREGLQRSERLSRNRSSCFQCDHAGTDITGDLPAAII
jgi:hypothetical protein